VQPPLYKFRWRGCRRRKLSALSSLFEYLCERNAIAGNPVDSAKREKVSLTRGCAVRNLVLENQAMRSRLLQVRLGMVTAMAKVIEYYVPERFRKTAIWIPSDQRGKIIEFPAAMKKSA
jgi:hypothetical protein